MEKDSDKVAYCGLYCGVCRQYLEGQCQGCLQNHSATWCHVRTCCMENKCRSCASCAQHPDPSSCRKLNGVMAKIIAFFFNSDRIACLKSIKSRGLEAHADYMAFHKSRTIRKR